MTLVHAGRGLDSYDSLELYAISAYLHIESSKRTEEEVKSRDATIGRMRSSEREASTGIPAVTERFRPADEM